MKWEPPVFVEINMNAEIGGYQSDFPDRDPRDPVVEDDGLWITSEPGPAGHVQGVSGVAVRMTPDMPAASTRALVPPMVSRPARVGVRTRDQRVPS